MKRYSLLLLLILLFSCKSFAQQMVYSSLRNFLAHKADTVSTLVVEKRSKQNIYLTGGADFKIYIPGNKGLSRYIKSRAAVVSADSGLYVNCKRLSYQRYKFGSWYAPALHIQNSLYFIAQPLGQEATKTLCSDYSNRLAGDVGNAIAASGIVNLRVVYQLDLSSGKVAFVGKEKLLSLFAPYKNLMAKVGQLCSEEASSVYPLLLEYMRCIGSCK